MGAVVDTLPGRLNLALVRGDELGHTLDFDVTLSGYSFQADVLSTVTGEQVVAMTVTPVNLSAGQVSVSLTETQTAALAAGSYSWRMSWTAPGTVKRTAIEGVLEVVA